MEKKQYNQPEIAFYAVSFRSILCSSPGDYDGALGAPMRGDDDF